MSILNGLPGPLSTILYFFIALFPLVLIHEIGHFVVAKLGACRVDEFGIGFPPRMVRLFKRGDTEYTLNWLPLGGFVKLAGEDDPLMPGAFAARPKRVRAAVLFAGPVANFLLAALIFAGIAGLGLAREPVPAIQGVSVAQVFPDQPAFEAGVKEWDIITAVNGRPVAELPAPETAVAGPTGPLLQALIDETDRQADQPMKLTVLRGAQLLRGNLQVAPGAGVPADLAGLNGAQRIEKAGDGLESGDLVIPPYSAAAGAAAGAADATSAGPAILRGAKVVELTVTPRRSGDDQKGRMGIQISDARVAYQMSLVEAPLYGLRTTASTIGAMVFGLAAMVTRQANVDVAGPVRIAQISQQAGQAGLDVLLTFIALLSVNLGVINLLPIPALDGGRILFIVFEAIRGRRIEPTREAVVHFVGFALVVGLMLVLTGVEIFKMSGLGGKP